MNSFKKDKKKTNEKKSEKRNDPKAIEMAAYIQANLLSLNYIIHRYNSFSTGSIYLKVDYGVGGSIRIANHEGKKHLNYRFNLCTNADKEGVKTIQNNVCDRHFYNLGSMDRMISDIILFRESRINKYGGLKNYLRIVEKAKRESVERQKGFWSNAIEVKLSNKEIISTWIKKNKLTYEKMDRIVNKVRTLNIKLDELLKNKENGWKDFDMRRLDLVMLRYKELNESAI